MGRQESAQQTILDKVSAYVKADVVPIAEKFTVGAPFLQRLLQQRALTQDDVNQYFKAMTRLGSALNQLPRDFLTSQLTGRDDSVQIEVRGALSDLRPILNKLPNAHTYQQQADKLMNATTVEQIGVESRLEEDRDRSDTEIRGRQ